MAIVVLKLPVVKQKEEQRPKSGPYGEGQIFQRWGRVRKPVKDTRRRSVQVYRYCCCHCQRTFRRYPGGSSSADQTERLKLFAVICWRMGLSHRGVSRMLSGLGIFLSHMSVWREAQAQAEVSRKQNQWKPVRVLGLDGAYVLGWGEERPVLVAVDLGTGDPISVGYVNEYDPQAVRRWLQPLVQQHGITVIVTDDLQTYRIVANQLNPGHQVCQFHLRRWVGKTLKELQQTVPKTWTWVLDEIHQVLDVLPPDGSQRLYTLWRQLPGRHSRMQSPRTPLEQLRSLALRLSEHWQSYCTFQSEPEVPWTNNGRERHWTDENES
jgi:transposase-like protein